MQEKSKKNEFFFQEQDIFIDFHKKIYKKDKIFLEFLVKKIVSDSENIITITIKSLLQILDFKTKDEFEKFLNKFLEKRIIYLILAKKELFIVKNKNYFMVHSQLHTSKTCLQQIQL